MVYGKHFKNFTMITTSYNCNKKCPYCIAKIDKLEEKEEDLLAFESAISALKNRNCKFEYFVLSGNGESSLYSYGFLKRVKRIVENSGIFKEKRIQTSGNLFLDGEKFKLFEDWIIEITRVVLDYKTDSSILNYKEDYYNTDNIHKARLRVNIVLLKNRLDKLTDTIKLYLNSPNIEIAALKILDNKDNEWITENMIGYDTLNEIVDCVSKVFGTEIKEFSNYLWYYKGKTITMSGNEDYLEKDLDSLYWYGNDFLKRI